MRFRACRCCSRLSFRAQDKERLLFRANRFAIAGIAFLALSICGATFLITSMVFGTSWAPVVPSMVVVLIAATWYVVPLMRKLASNREA